MGCTKIDPGCKNCYMFTAQRRYGKDPAVVVRSKTTFNEPLRWQKYGTASGKPLLVFTCSWSDWFHDDADQWRDEAWNVIRQCPDLTFQILTKRADRIAAHLPVDWGTGYDNVWLGVSISEPNGVWRADELRKVMAVVRFISYEPALGPLAGVLDLTGIGWLIYGGESGPGYRREDKQWARDIRDKCHASGTAFFHKQSAGPFPESGIELDGEIIREYPVAKPPPRSFELQFGQ